MIDEKIKDTSRPYLKPGWLKEYKSDSEGNLEETRRFKLNNDTKREKRSGGQERTTYFCIGFSKI